MKSFRILSLLVVTSVLSPTLFAADFGVRGGRYNDAGTEFVGAELFFDLGALNVNPNLEYLLEDDVTAGTANLDVTFDLANVATFRPYVGAGIGLAYTEASDTSAETDILGNLIGGIALNLQFLQPYAQVKYFRSLDDEDGGDNDELALTIGLRF